MYTHNGIIILSLSLPGLYYEHACNAVYQEMCFHEASKLNQGHSPKTFIAPSRQGGVATQQSGGTAHSTNLANKSAVTQSKVSVASKPGAGGNLKQTSGGSIGKDGVPQVIIAHHSHSVYIAHELSLAVEIQCIQAVLQLNIHIFQYMHLHAFPVFTKYNVSRVHVLIFLL